MIQALTSFTMHAKLQKLVMGAFFLLSLSLLPLVPWILTNNTQTLVWLLLTLPLFLVPAILLLILAVILRQVRQKVHLLQRMKEKAEHVIDVIEEKY